VIDVPALVVEATRKAGVVWLAVPGRPRAVGAWFVWHEGEYGPAAYVVTGAGEQEIPGLAQAPECAVSVPSADKGGRIATWTAAVRRVEPGSEEWAAIVPGMLGKRLNLPDQQAAEQRWASGCAVLRLAPTGVLTEAGATLPDGSLAQAPARSAAR
jgi:hypothetical protein